MAEASYKEDLGATSATKNLSSTKDLSQTMPNNDELNTTLREGRSLIDRFYDGGNRARPEALQIIVVVLDSVVRRMREQYAGHASSRPL